MEGAMMPPEMMMPPAPPPPDPVQVAVTEIGAELAEQAAGVAQQLAEQERDLSNQLNILDAVMQRAMQVESEMSGVPMGEPVGAPPGAAGPPEGPGVAGPGMTEPMPVEEPMAAEMAGEAGPMMEDAAGLEDPAAFEATAIGSMASNPDLRSAVAMYVPVLEQSLDHLSKLLMTLWIQEEKYRAELGENDFSELEERLRTVLSNLGSLVLRINQTAMAAKPEDEVAAGP
jgi:hypothetical protein